jgi:hypothetical protein
MSNRLEHLVSKLTLNSTPLELMPNGILDLHAMDVHAALGMGHLSLEAYLMGKVVYCGDETSLERMLRLGTEHIDRLMKAEGWSQTKPNAWCIDLVVAAGAYTLDDVAELRAEFGQQLKQRMAQVVLRDLKNNNNCVRCGGTGRTKDYRLCAACEGTGYSPYPEVYKYSEMFIQKGAWHKTWRRRYQIVYQMFNNWLIEFEQHLIIRCR